MLKLQLFLVFVTMFRVSVSINKTFRYNVNADNPENFERSNDCRGFLFPKSFENACMMSLGKIETNEIFLPVNGDVVFRENAEIVFKENSKSCIKVKQPTYSKYTSPKSWSSELSDNLAVPDADKIPSACDNVIFPKDALYSVDIGDNIFYVDNFYYRDVLINKQKDLAMQNSCPEFIGNGLIHRRPFRRHPCILMAPLTEEKRDAICNTFQSEPVKCSEPTDLIGHCTGFCGAVIRLEYPEISWLYYQHIPIENLTKDFAHLVDSYYSETKIGKIQISITDKDDFTGESIYYAKKLHEDIKRIAKEYDITNLTLHTSGMPLVGGKIAKNAFGFILGTLFFVLCTFGVLYAFYEGPFRYYTFSTRFNLSRYNQALRRSVIFSRFDNREGGISIAGSVMSLEKAFDNPMFGHPVPSTSHGNSTETVVDAADEVQEAEENDLKLEEHDSKLEEPYDSKVGRDSTKGAKFKNLMFEDNDTEAVPILEGTKDGITMIAGHD